VTNPTVTREEALNAFRTLGRLLQETYQVTRDELLSEISVSVPATIFCGKLSPFASLASYLSQQGLDAKQIAQLTKRTKTFVTQSIQEAEFDIGGKSLPLTIFSGELSVLEAAAHYLKSQGMRNSEIAKEIGKSASTIWMLIKRANQKQRGESQ